jgi:hypothetical protein
VKKRKESYVAELPHLSNVNNSDSYFSSNYEIRIDELAQAYSTHKIWAWALANVHDEVAGHRWKGMREGIKGTQCERTHNQ